MGAIFSKINVSERETSDLLHISYVGVNPIGWFPASNDNSRAPCNNIKLIKKVKFCVFCDGKATKGGAFSAS